MLRYQIFICLMLIFCGMLAQKKPDRPFADWHFRAIVDDVQGAQVMALDEKIWLAYDTSTCRLFHIWHGGDTLFANRDSLTGLPVISTQYAFPYLSELPQDPVWVMLHNGQQQEVSTYFLGIREEEKQVWLTYRLKSAAGEAVVWESLDYFSKSRHRIVLPGLRRTFWVRENPNELTIGTKIRAEGLMKASDFSSSGKWMEIDKSKRMYDWGDLFDFEALVELKTGKTIDVEVLFSPQPEEVFRRRIVNQQKP